ncbi:MAG: hypothetical protein K2P80_05175 [Beijerinckiaceae bacterium]|nr:hypothetical protein [Beijerinckiaceae bacterium]
MELDGVMERDGIVSEMTATGSISSWASECPARYPTLAEAVRLPSVIAIMAEAKGVASPFGKSIESQDAFDRGRNMLFSQVFEALGPEIRDVLARIAEDEEGSARPSIMPGMPGRGWRPPDYNAGIRAFTPSECLLLCHGTPLNPGVALAFANLRHFGPAEMWRVYRILDDPFYGPEGIGLAAMVEPGYALALGAPGGFAECFMAAAHAGAYGGSSPTDMAEIGYGIAYVLPYFIAGCGLGVLWERGFSLYVQGRCRYALPPFPDGVTSPPLCLGDCGLNVTPGFSMGGVTRPGRPLYLAPWARAMPPVSQASASQAAASKMAASPAAKPFTGGRKAGSVAPRWAAARRTVSADVLWSVEVPPARFGADGLEPFVSPHGGEVDPALRFDAGGHREIIDFEAFEEGFLLEELFIKRLYARYKAGRPGREHMNVLPGVLIGQEPTNLGMVAYWRAFEDVVDTEFADFLPAFRDWRILRDRPFAREIAAARTLAAREAKALCGP